MKQPALLQKGFTLIELIVVMAVIAILAGIVLVGLNPVEQTRKANDASRTETVSKLGEAVLRYQIGKSTLPLATDTTWQTTLQTNSDIKATASNGATGTNACTTNNQGGYCYAPTGTDFIVYTGAESGASFAQGACTTGQVAWIVYSSAQQKTGIGCTTNASTQPNTTTALK